jgi:hypothetical protein
MLELFTSLVHNYKSKIRNPLIGTIASVWIIHNWRIVYALFNFDKECTMQDRINYINDYFSKKIFFNEFVIIISIAFGVIITTFILLAISRFLTDGFYKIVEPSIINLLDKNTVFTNVDKKKLELKIDGLNNNLVRLRDGNSKLENQNILLISRAEQNEKQYDDKLLEFSEFQKSAFENYELLQNKNIPANKVINYFDDIINGLNDQMKKEFLIYIQHNDNIKGNKYENFVGLKNQLEKMGVIITVDGVLKNTVLGLLFLEYYKSLPENNLTY